MNKKEQMLIGIAHIIHDDNLFGTRFECFLIKAFLKKYTKGKDKPLINSGHKGNVMLIHTIIKSNKYGKSQAIQKLFEHKKL